MQGLREAELKRALDKAQPLILSCMARVTQLVGTGEAERAAAEALAESRDAMDLSLIHISQGIVR